MASVLTPASAAARTSSTGSRTPSDRSVWVWRSTVETPLSAVAFGRRPCRASGRSATSNLDEALDPLDREGPARRRIDVDLGGVEDHRTVADREPRRQGVDEARQDRGGIEPDHAPDWAGHPEVGLVRGPARQDPLVAGDDVGVGPDDRADP